MQQKLKFKPNFFISLKGVAIFGASLGILALTISMYLFWLVSAQSNWVGTYAKVTDGAVIHIGRRPYFYKVRLKYQYLVEGNNYLGECEITPKNASSAEAANALLATYTPDGLALQIYYDPKNPKSSQGNKGEPLFRAWQFLVGGISSLVAAFLINCARQKKLD